MNSTHLSEQNRASTIGYCAKRKLNLAYGVPSCVPAKHHRRPVSFNEHYRMSSAAAQHGTAAYHSGVHGVAVSRELEPVGIMAHEGRSLGG